MKLKRLLSSQTKPFSNCEKLITSLYSSIVEILETTTFTNRMITEHLQQWLNTKESLMTIQTILRKNTRTKEDIFILNTYLKTWNKFMTIIQTNNDKETGAMYADVENNGVDGVWTKVTKSWKSQNVDHNIFFFRVGEIGTRMYIILQGNVTVLVPKEKKLRMTYTQLITHLKIWNSFNEEYWYKRTWDANTDVFNINRNEVKFLPNAVKNKYRVNITIENYIKILNCEDIISSDNGGWFFEDEEKYPVSIWSYYNVVSLAEGCIFGETALNAQNQWRTASIFVTEKSYFGYLERSDYNNSIKSIQMKIKQENTNFILSTHLFSGWPASFLVSQFWNYFSFRQIFKGDKIFIQGENEEKLFFIIKGKIKITSNLNPYRWNEVMTSLNKKIGNTWIIKSGKLKDEVKDIENMPISIINNKDILGWEDCSLDNSIYFCTAECASTKVDLFEIDLKILKNVEVKYSVVRENFNKMKTMKIEWMINRWKSIQFTKYNQMINNFKTKINKWDNFKATSSARANITEWFGRKVWPKENLVKTKEIKGKNELSAFANAKKTQGRIIQKQKPGQLGKTWSNRNKTEMNIDIETSFGIKDVENATKETNLRIVHTKKKSRNNMECQTDSFTEISGVDIIRHTNNTNPNINSNNDSWNRPDTTRKPGPRNEKKFIWLFNKVKAVTSWPRSLLKLVKSHKTNDIGNAFTDRQTSLNEIHKMNQTNPNWDIINIIDMGISFEKSQNVNFTSREREKSNLNLSSFRKNHIAVKPKHLHLMHWPSQKKKDINRRMVTYIKRKRNTKMIFNDQMRFANWSKIEDDNKRIRGYSSINTNRNKNKWNNI